MAFDLDTLGREFRTTFGYPSPEHPIAIPRKRAEQHIQMIRDEFEKELVPALLSGDVVETYDAGVDVMVYILNLLGESGLPLHPGIAEVHRSNMSKLGPDGLPIKAGKNDPSGEPEGKTLKGPNYFTPNLRGIVDVMRGAQPLFMVAEDDPELDEENEVVPFGCTICGSWELNNNTLVSHARDVHDIEFVWDASDIIDSDDIYISHKIDILGMNDD